MSLNPMKRVHKMPTPNVADLLSKIEHRVNVLGSEKINLGRFINEADYRNELVHKYSKSEDPQLRKLAREAIGLKIVKDIEFQGVTTDSESSFSSWITNNFYFLSLGTSIVLFGTAVGFFSHYRSQTRTDAVEMVSIGRAKLAESAKAAEPVKLTTKLSNENVVQLPVERPRSILRMHGSNTLDTSLAPALANGYLESIGASETLVVKTDRSADQYIQGYLATTEEAVAVEIFAHGSSTAFKDLAAGKADIGMSSRPITTEEREQLGPVYGDLTSRYSEIVIGLDGLTVIVNEHNPIESLTISQVSALFAGRFTNWSHVGGSPGPVNIYVPDDNSGTYDVFERLVLKRYNKVLSAEAKRYISNTELSADVAMDPNGIGFVDLSHGLGAKPLAIAASNSTTPLFPTSFTIASEDYSLARRLYFYVVKNIDNPHIQGMVDFTLSETGQEIMKKAGVISRNIYAVKPNIRSGMPRDYLALTKHAERLSVTFHFKFDQTELDNKGKRDLTRLVNYMEKHLGKHFMLFGFSDNIGSTNANLQLSQVRAHIVENHLLPYGLSPIVVKGFGEVLPIASNHTTFGRNKNRRVEVWVN